MNKHVLSLLPVCSIPGKYQCQADGSCTPTLLYFTELYSTLYDKTTLTQAADRTYNLSSCMR